MGKIEWAMWANEQGIISSGVLFLGGLLAVLSLTFGYRHDYWEIAAYAIAFSILMFILEHPRSKRKKGRTIQRSFQQVTSSIVDGIGFFGKNYFFRFLLYALGSIPCLLNLGTVMGGLSTLVTASIYFVAAIGGESWIPCEKVVPVKRRYTREAPPSKAPPRLQLDNVGYNKGLEDAYVNC